MASTNRKLFSFTALLLVLWSHKVASDRDSDCFIDKFNVARLSAFNPWKVVDGKGELLFDISLCGTTCAGGITVHAKNQTTGRNTTFGACNNHNFTDEEERSELMAIITGDACAETPGEHTHTIIYFKCGKTLGTPVFLEYHFCTAYFEWETIEFCKDMDMSAEEIPCSIVNDSKIIDLSPLSKQHGGYLVDSQNNRTFYINVCRGIKPDAATGTEQCPKGSASCRVIYYTGDDMGRPTHRLQMTSDGDIKLVYTTTHKASGCLETPTTTIYFKCPERGGSRDPLLIGDFLCNVEIEWFTEYACPQQILTNTSAKPCRLTMETHNIDIDLTPLKNGSPYLVAGTSGTDHYQYHLGICDTAGSACADDGSTFAAACQKKSGDPTFNKQIGQTDHAMLRYSDGDLFLIYKNGDQCHTNFRRQTVIAFHCQKDAENGGIGKPVFREDDNCTYFFDWNTAHACVNHPVESSCSLQHGSQRFDLSNLIVDSGNNWVAVVDWSSQHDDQYFINVCHDVLQEGPAENCPPGAAVCEISSGGSYNLGSYSEGPAYDPVTGHLYLNYTASAGTQTAEHCSSVFATIYFICKPGEQESGPRLVLKSQDHCFHQFEWHTAAACPLSHQQGTGCKVVDAQAGYSFDLSTLSRPQGYKVSADEYDFYINVCDKLAGDHCQQAPHDNAAVCQVKPAGSASDDKKTGEPNGNLAYYDGVLNLTYTNGEPYNDDSHTPRTTEIAFICDPSAGVGSPEFVHEQAQTYNFKWLTAYACPTQPVECVAVDENGVEYDLSSLSKSAAGENWVVLDDSNPADPKTFYINVCRPLAPIPSLAEGSCSILAAACGTQVTGGKETVLVRNMGQAKSAPTAQRGRIGYISLVYADGDPCPEGGPGARYNTTIHFICSKGQESRGPSPPRKEGCSFEVLWHTEAACEITEGPEQGSDSGAWQQCSVTDPTSNFTYNLHSLRKTGEGDDHYTVVTSDKTRTFWLNICGPVAQCGKLGDKDSSVCEVRSSDKAPLAYLIGMKRPVIQDGGIMLTYLGNSTGQDDVVVKIELTCDRTVGHDMTPIFVRQEGLEYVFQLATPVACPPQPVDCMVQDSAGHQYDLTPLAKVTGNWDVPDTRPSHTNLRYHINVCVPVNQGTDITCPGGPIGGCQTGGGDAFNLGYIQSKPTVAEDGTISLRYVGGTLCHQGKPNQAYRSMRINFYCDAQEGEPVFLGESPTCEYSFSWRTPSACPLQRAEGSECTVTEPLYNYQFDLTPLRKTDSDYNVTGGGYTFLLNVCGALHSAPAPCQDAAVCQQGSTLSSPVPLGKPNTKLIYDAGELSLVYDEGQKNCHGNYTRQTVLNFRCSREENEQGPRFVSEKSDCTYMFDWPTRHACPPHTVVDCSYTDSKGNFYDLSSLAKADSNYVETGTDGTKIIFNICRSLVHRKGETCPFDSAACLVNSTATDLTKKYVSLGRVSSNPISFEEGKIVIQYNMGDTCSSGGPMSTMIIFSCPSDQGGAQEEGPQTHYMKDGCQYTFVWGTSAACPVKSPQSGQNCTVTSPNGYEFNLRSLSKSKGWEVNDREGHMFKINVCGPLTGTTCSANTGSCQSEISGDGRSFSAGLANAQLEYQRDGVVRLNYSGGDVCHHNDAPRTTIISFICQEAAGLGRPVFVASSDGCLYYFDWHTNLVCEQQTTCRVDADGKTFDLTPLIKQSGHHLVLPDAVHPPHGTYANTAGAYYINVCRPLNPIPGTLCPAGAAACRVQAGKPPQGLGQAHSPPIYDADRTEVILSYDGDWPCVWDPSINASSRIIFRCKPGPQQGMPRLTDVSESCEYIFEWETNVLCPDDVVEKENASCSFYDTRTETTYDLSSLSDLYQVPSNHGGKFTVQACGARPASFPAACQGSAVCLQGSNGIPDGSYGQASTGEFEMVDEKLSLKFSGGRDCQTGGGKATTVIMFECDYGAGKGQPVLWPHTPCEVTFNWRTSLVCPPLVQECALADGDTTYDLTVLSQAKKSFEYKATDGSTYWVNLCQAVHGPAHQSQCPPQAAVCRHTKDGRVDMLGNVNTQKMTTQRAADGNLTVVVEYSQGASACSSNRRRSNNQAAKSIIRLTCGGSTIGGPRLVKKQDDACVFEFEWQTRVMCEKDSGPVQLKDVNHVITDPRSGGAIDLRPLLTGGDHTAQDDHCYYAINLEGRLSAGGSACKGATICQLQPLNSSVHHVLGTFASRKYSLLEGKLEVEYTSPEKCTGRYKDKNVTSIIHFTCAQDATQTGEPKFMYNSKDCVYLFTWDTPAACIQAKVEVQIEGSASGADSKASTSSSVNKSKLGAIVGVISAVIFICVLAIVFHKPERRAAAARGLKRLLPCRRSFENQMKYSVLSQMDEDPEVAVASSNPFEEDEETEEKELQNGDPVMVRAYHDDSDDDMLL